MYNTTTSITLLITLLFTSASVGCLRAHQLVSQLGISWLFTDAWSTYPAYKIHSYKHLNLLVILLFTFKVASGSPAITPWTFNNLLLSRNLEGVVLGVI